MRGLRKVVGFVAPFAILTLMGGIFSRIVLDGGYGNELAGLGLLTWALAGLYVGWRDSSDPGGT